MTPDELLRRYPGATVRWLRRRLGMGQADLARYLETTLATVAAWEARDAPLAPSHRTRLDALLAHRLATPEGQAWLATLPGDRA